MHCAFRRRRQRPTTDFFDGYGRSIWSSATVKSLLVHSQTLPVKSATLVSDIHVSLSPELQSVLPSSTSTNLVLIYIGIQKVCTICTGAFPLFERCTVISHFLYITYLPQTNRHHTGRDPLTFGYSYRSIHNPSTLRLHLLNRMVERILFDLVCFMASDWMSSLLNFHSDQQHRTPAESVGRSSSNR